MASRIPAGFDRRGHFVTAAQPPRKAIPPAAGSCIETTAPHP